MNLGKLTLITLTGTLVFMALMNRAIAPLTGPEIIAFELCNTVEKTTAMIQDWQQRSLIGTFIHSLYWDIAYPILYASLIGLACLWSTEDLSFTWKSISKKLAIAMAFAALLDFVENYAMYSSVMAGPTTLSVSVSFWAASLKFVIICASVCFFCCALMMKMLRNEK